MGDWQELLQSVVIGLVFSYLVAKLIATVLHFRGENLRVVREDELARSAAEPSGTASVGGDGSDGGKMEGGNGGDAGISGSNVGNDGDGGEGDDEDDEWEGVESTELDELFSAATAFVAATAADRSAKVGSDVQLQLYELYKIATEGPCTVPQPSPLKMTARAKWNAWQKLGAMPPEEAMEKYVMIVSELFPSWAAGSAVTRSHDEDIHASNSSTKGPMGPVFSSFIHEEGSDDTDLKLDAIHASAREGEADNLVKFLDSGIPVDPRDGEGRTPLHWAVDRGHLHIVKLLISRKADVNAKDDEGQTPLHYAILCEREEIAELLVKHGAARDVKDNDGTSPCDLCGSSWDFMTSAN